MATTMNLQRPALAPALTLGARPVLAYLAAAYFTVSLALPRLLSADVSVYLVQPLLWSGLALLCRQPTPGLLARPRTAAIVFAALAALFQVSVFAVAGLVYGFGYSTHAHGVLATSLNLVYLASMLWGLECARACLLRHWSGRPGLAFFAATAVIAAAAVPLSVWQTALGGGQPAFEASGRTLLPAAAESSLATLLTLASGPWAAFTYRFIVAAAEWTSPVLPNLDWMLAALAGTVAPAAAFLALRSMAAREEPAGPRAIPGWVLAFSATIVAVIWLNTGLLGVRPALVSGVSMEPNLVLGDIVVTRQVPAASLRVGDVIRFQSGAVPVLHRITEVKRVAEGLVFVTQGDNNNAADAPVPADAVEGRVVLVIPKLGIVPVKVKTWLAR